MNNRGATLPFCWRKSCKRMTLISRCGMTLLEILVVCSIIGILSAIAIPAYSNHIQKTKVNTVIADIKGLEVIINAYYADNLCHPTTLADVNKAGLLDPWGHPYEYLNIANADTNAKGKLRKDKNLVPINTDYDLYSMGKDGKSTSPLTAKSSQDDIIRASDGKYVGLASGY